MVDTETLPAGIYFVRLEAQNGARKTRVVSQVALRLFWCIKAAFLSLRQRGGFLMFFVWEGGLFWDSI